MPVFRSSRFPRSPACGACVLQQTEGRPLR
ncbi:MAG: hypothetical protein ACOVNK_03850 [Sphingorhabdus lacus]